MCKHKHKHKDMTLNEAINHALEQADVLGVCECATEHIQLAQWLLELRRLRLETDIHKGSFDGRWRDCEEELPPETTWCLVCADGAMACRAWNADKREWEDWEDCRSAGLVMSQITHWMPLPNKPEKSEDEDD